MSDEQQEPRYMHVEVPEGKWADETHCIGDTSWWNGEGLRCQIHGGWWPLREKKCDRAEVPVQ